MKHTKGDWKILHGDIGIILGGDGKMVADVRGNENNYFDATFRSQKERYANALLISLGPEMLKVIEVIGAFNPDAFSHLKDKPDHTPIYEFNQYFLTIGDVRRARKILDKLKGSLK